MYKGEYFYNKRKSNGSFFCTSSDNSLYFFIKFSENPFYLLKVIEPTQFQTENYKGT